MPASEDRKRSGPLARLYQKAGLSGPVALILGLLFLLVPLLPGEFPTIVAAEVLILGLFALSFNMIYGYMGQISFGHAAFFGLGAYGTALFFRACQAATGDIGYLDFFLSLLLSIPVSALGALMVGFFCVRLTGIYFAILSLAFGELIFYVVFSWYDFTRGDDGIQGLLPPPSLGMRSTTTISPWRWWRSPCSCSGELLAPPSATPCGCSGTTSVGRRSSGSTCGSACS
jgi:branched-chain amino acid transport system permease protein